MEELLNRRDAIEKMILEKETDIKNIKVQLTDYRTSNSANRTASWYGKANSAMLIKKGELNALKHKRELICRQIKEENKKIHTQKELSENHLFFLKLQEVLPAEEFAEFITYVKKVIEAGGE